ncbi:hypothetical protein [Streptomyces sp. NBC_01718]
MNGGGSRPAVFSYGQDADRVAKDEERTVLTAAPADRIPSQ